ncbi:MAG: reverse transcriptase domain-containing protein [Candidatus Thiodiazotropha taylori]|nr:hypothetical protein [Candidatus Thiodiazotropha taylori]MCG8113706.1 hypothetical protein [Candidatus Thiodiazotropha taylori]MCW4286066.1 reverse transcriptase domain-containing protein [Candidatus Thiodiazotropha taylori]MCW4334467.1 reverse transcriptase domain-containing protein [Candidatus Thiodiazotropha endolucinida]
MDSEIFPSHLGYNPPIRRDRSTGAKGGGVFILVSDRLVVSAQPQLSTGCEIVWAKVQVVGTKPLLIAAYYRPSEHDQVSAEELKKSLALVDPSKSHIWIMGDFNFPKLSWEDYEPVIKPDCSNMERYQDFISTLDDNCLTQMVQEPTRENNILDLFLTNSPTLVDSLSVVPGISDHQAVTSIVRLRPSIQKIKPRDVNLYSKADWVSMKQEMQEFQSAFLSTCEGKSTDQLWQEFKGEVDALIKRYVPTKTLRGRKNLPWVTQEIRRKMNLRDHLYQLQKTNDSDRERFKKVKHEVDCMIKTSYNNYLDSLVGVIDDSLAENSSRPNNKKLFSYLKNCRQDSQGSAPLKQNGQLSSDNMEKANILNNQFQSVFTPKSPLKLSQLCTTKILDLQDEGLLSYDQISPDLRKKVPDLRNKVNSMPDIDISTNGILKLLQGLNPNKAAGPDRIKPLLLQKLSLEIAPILQVIFTKSLDEGSLPSDWLKANVSPIFKKGDKSSPANYRPISLTCILCKILEHIMTSNLVKHLDGNQILYDLQHGFRAKRSCETQLTMLIEELHRNIQDGRQTDIILLDFSKAFDKVSHEKLIYKLHGYGVRGRNLRWIKSFLNGRSQTVVLEGDCSEEVPVTSGVPQGSVLGPILFLAYINDLPDKVKSQVRLFADDTAAYLAINSLADSEQLQDDLKILQDWEVTWNMEFNPGKCQVVRVTRSQDPILTTYKLHDQTLEVVPCARYLGVDISHDLSWKPHITRITASANKSLGFLRRNLKAQNPQLRERAYKAVVRPKLEYAAPVWDPHTQDDIGKIEMVQRRAARWVLNDYSTHSKVSKMLEKLSWRTLEQRRADSRLVLFYKIIHGYVAVPLPTYIVPISRASRRTTHSLAYRQIQTRTDYYKYSFYPLTIVQWNCLPSTVATLTTIDSFKRAVSQVCHIKP